MVGRPHGNRIRGGALQFQSILDQDAAVFCLGNFMQHGIGEGRFAAARPANNKNVLFSRDRGFYSFFLFFSNNLLLDIITQSKNLEGFFTDSKYRLGDNWWKHALKTVSAAGQFGRYDGLRGTAHATAGAGHKLNDPLRIRRFYLYAAITAAFAQSVHPEMTVRVEHKFNNVFFFQ